MWSSNVLRSDQIQEGLVSYLKSKPDITDLLYNSGSNQIKEDQWKGTVAFYPGVRVRIISNSPAEGGCFGSKYSAGIQVFSEEASSLQSDMIAGVIAGIMDSRGFTSSGVAFTSNVTNVIPAIAETERTWRSEVLIDGMAS
jgi:hypothetical protein